MKRQRGEILLVCLLFAAIVTAATAIHELYLGHSPTVADQKRKDDS